MLFFQCDNNSPSCSLDGSIEAEIITFLQKKERPFRFFCLFYPVLYIFQGDSPSRIEIRPQRPFIPKIVFLSAP